MKPLLIATALLALSACTTVPHQTTRDEALDFLYASMPLPDSVDYSRDFWLANIDCALRARNEMPWGKTIPEREWRHFVLPVRVNNENLDTCRMVFYRQLKDRVKDLSMADAILEVNHWCHERVTYQPTDERTSSPLATIRTAYGRCGEESTFLVAALRSVGIPARQVYTPRWAHTDDNHAWVEAWADGRWHFLGACEPEPVLDLGWFNAPASRAMLMHTKVFGQYDGPEEVMQRNACFTEIDVTNGYALVARSYVQVLDNEGNPVADATVEFKIYNYAEFYTVARRQTDHNGLTSMQAGLGDLICWASKDYLYGFNKIHIGDNDTLRLTLNHYPGERYSLDFDIVPPVQNNTLPEVTTEQREFNNQRLAYEDSLRNAYVSTFPVTDDPLILASRGNHEVIRSFLEAPTVDGKDVPVAIRRKLLSTLSDKDLHDITPDVLEDAFFGINPDKPEAIDGFYMQYVVCPRVLNEGLRPYKAFFANEITEQQKAEWHDNPTKLVAWISENIQLDTLRNPQNLRMSPIEAWRNRQTDATSRDILFVALARTCFIPARIDPVTRKVQIAALSDHQWKDVLFNFSDYSESSDYSDHSDYSDYSDYSDHSDHSESPTLSLSYSPSLRGKGRSGASPKYYIHFTLSKIQNGTATLLNYGEDNTYETLFGNKKTQALDPGDYLLITGTRMANGSVLVHVEVAPIEQGQTTRLPLVLRQAETGLQVIGSFNSENLYNDQKQGPKTLLSSTGRGYYILGIIAPGNEPTNHALRDIAQYKEAIDKWGGTLILLFRNEQEANRFNLADYPLLPNKTVIGTDIDGKILSELCNELHLKGTPPIFIIADTFNRVVFLSEGYTIGLGEQLSRAISSL
ncbi:MAG: transglutaminase domain-containing protein [Bacteroidales bacterium]|nr:transglutaminase domain-containing protein [Bacteroidales bacterium]